MVVDLALLGAAGPQPGQQVPRRQAVGEPPYGERRQLAGRQRGGVPVGEVFWDVKDDAGATVWSTGQAEPSAILQAGRYRVRAETREKRYERALELRPGETKVLELTAD